MEIEVYVKRGKRDMDGKMEKERERKKTKRKREKKDKYGVREWKEKGEEGR